MKNNCKCSLHIVENNKIYRTKPLGPLGEIMRSKIPVDKLQYYNLCPCCGELLEIEGEQT